MSVGRYFWCVPLLAGVALIAAGRDSRAFDHGDSPATVKDVDGDITDVYTFMKPVALGDGGFAPSSDLVLVMNFNPSAKADYRPPTNIDYVFRIRAVTDPATLAYDVAPDATVSCQFTDEMPQRLFCNVNGTPAFATVGATDGGGIDDAGAGLRLFAGLRSDPAFADVPAFTDTVASGQLKFKNPGTNSFQGKNVMSIVIELPLSNLYGVDAGGASPLLAVAGSTTRN